MPRRLPSKPPTLPGFSFVRVLGSGGFADVFLYEQNSPRRQVAVKVMLADVITPELQQMFQAEANLMAQLSSHPSILTVYQTGVTADRRPYLVMELCSAALGQSYRSAPLAVTDALRIGIQIAGAVETAHRAGVLHRDIKPSNILVTAYGHPVLSDFGIAASLSDWDAKEAVGLSIPWSAPEMLLDDTSGSIDSEVWSLAATVYSLLAGRSPFEVPGKENTPAELISRITRTRPHKIGRPDVPARLEAVLDKAMARKPSARHAGVLELIRDLQSVERELGFSQTRAEIQADEWASATAADDGDRTLIRKIVSVDAGRRPGRRRPKTSIVPAAGGQVSSPGGGSSGAGQPGTPNRISRAMIWTIVLCSALVVALGTTSVVVLVRAASANEIPIVRDVAGQSANGTVVFSWNDPGLQPNDAYEVQVDDGAPSIQHGTRFQVDQTDGTPVCITVSVNRDGTSGKPSSRKCVDPGEG